MRKNLQISEKSSNFAALLLNDMHNKDYSVVKTFRVGGNSRPFLFPHLHNKLSEQHNDMLNHKTIFESRFETRVGNIPS